MWKRMSEGNIRIDAMNHGRFNYSLLDADGKGITRWKLLSRWFRRRRLCVCVTIVLLVLGYAIFNRRRQSRPPIKPRPRDVSEERKNGLSIDGDIFLLDGHPFRILSGSIHYFRVPRAYWKDRLLKLKAAGLNTVDTYVAWNLHEEERGHYDFSGNLDIVEFLTIARDLGLYALVRPGPYICAEWDWGGLPPWLLSDPSMKIRTLHRGYTEPVELFLAELFRRIGPLQRSKTKDGPIIGVQIENEYGSYGEDKAYLLWLKKALLDAGVVEFMFTSDGADLLERGFAPGVLATVNFNDKTDAALDALEQFQPNMPVMSAEFWPGWFDHWYRPHHVMLPDDMVQRLEPLFERKASVNLYMFHGGTNFGFMNGGNLHFDESWTQNYAVYLPTVTSYGYDAPLSEHGGKTEKYQRLKDLIFRHMTADEKQSYVEVDAWKHWRAPVPYGQSPVLTSLTLTDALEHLQALPVDLQRPVFVEQVQAEGAHQLYFGFVAYRTSIPSADAKRIVLQGVVGDRMLVIVDGRTVEVFETKYVNKPFTMEVDLTKFKAADHSKKGKDTQDLILLVENMGRANYARTPHLLDGMYKGFNGTVMVDGAVERVVLDKWKVYSIRFKTPAELRKMVLAATAGSQWKPAVQMTSASQPAFYKVEFNIDNVKGEFPDDTFANMKEWTKGVMYANGVNLGRYWKEGPTQTLYVPGPWLKKGANELIIFELHQPGSRVNLNSEAELGEECPMPCYD